MRVMLFGVHHDYVPHTFVDVVVWVAHVQQARSHVEEEHAKSMGTTTSLMMGHVGVASVIVFR